MRISELQGTRLFLPVEWQRRGAASESSLAAQAAVEAVLSLPEPAELSFIVAAGGGSPATAGFIVSGIDPDRTSSHANEVRDVLAATNAWQGLGIAVPDIPELDDPDEFILQATDGPGRQIVNHRSAAWLLAAERPDRTLLRVDLISNADTASEDPGIDCRVTVAGSGMTASTVATLIASDLHGPVRVAAATRHNIGDDTINLPLEMVAHLISTPARMPDVWPANKQADTASLLDTVDQSIPPHAVWFGGSGQGKTTLLVHQIQHSLDAGNAVAVVCPHGDLAERAAQLFSAHGACDAFNFASDAPPRWNLTHCPADVAPEDLVGSLYQAIRAAWPNSPEEWFGPVGRKVLSTGVAALISGDEHGPSAPLTKLGDVLVPRDKDRWRNALRARDNLTVLSELEMVWQSIENDSNGHMAVWTTSKIEPFVSSRVIKSILGSRETEVSMNGLIKGRSTIVSAPSPRLGDEASNLLLTMVLTDIWRTIKANPITDHHLDVFIDEVQRIPAPLLAEILAEGRKFGLRLRLATQSPLALPSQLREAILTNCGSIGTFRIGTREANILEPLFPLSPVSALTRSPVHQVTVSLGDKEMTTRPNPPSTRVGDPVWLEHMHQRTSANSVSTRSSDRHRR